MGGDERRAAPEEKTEPHVNGVESATGGTCPDRRVDSVRTMPGFGRLNLIPAAHQASPDTSFPSADQSRIDTPSFSALASLDPAASPASR